MSDPNTVSLIHLGCARNLIDSELILGRMAEQGLMVSGVVEDAGTVVINTCSFIGPAEKESSDAIRVQLDRKARGELEHVVVAGCLVQRYKRKLQERFPRVDLFAEISNYRELAGSIRKLADGGKVPAYLEGPVERKPEREGARLLATPKSFAYLRISHGCDHKCTFCTIPSIRGKHRSKTIEALCDEARELVACGVRELVLVAEDSTAWGRDLGKRLPELIEALAATAGVHWVRLMYAYPNDFPWELTGLLRDNDRVATYLDIPVQHAATGVLRGMARAGTGDQVRRLLDRLHDEVPGIMVRTTLLMGFPGETDSDAEEVLDLLRTYRLSRVGAFVFSPEPGTPSFEMENQVPEEDALARHAAVLGVRDELLREEQEKMIGKDVEVLVDESSDFNGIVGRIEQDAPEVDMITRVEGGSAQPGDLINARVIGLDEEFNLVCTAVESGESA
ncbi:MAG: ribosomal protein S12 methylthiotransferase [Planctomycetota bacterium]